MYPNFVNESVITAEFINSCYKAVFLRLNVCHIPRNQYLCIVFFIVLDLRLTRLGFGGIPFFMSVLHVPGCHTPIQMPNVSLSFFFILRVFGPSLAYGNVTTVTSILLPAQ